MSQPSGRILVVDDQPNVRTVAARILRDAGCKVIEAATAEEARRICVSEEETIDLAPLPRTSDDECAGVWEAFAQ